MREREFTMTRVENAKINTGIGTMYYAWAYALVPSLTSYKKLLSLVDEEKYLKTSMIWVIVAAVVSAVFGVSYFGLIRDFGVKPQLPTILFGVVMGLGILISIASILVRLSVITYISQFLSKRLGGNGKFLSLIYSYSSFISSITLISAIYYCIVGYLHEFLDSLLLDYMSYFTIILTVYQIVLSAFANKSVHGYSWKNAIISALPMLLYVSLYYLVLYYLVKL
jgi:hypothetical protein